MRLCLTARCGLIVRKVAANTEIGTVESDTVSARHGAGAAQMSINPKANVDRA
jgi:hypothetical protein